MFLLKKIYRLFAKQNNQTPNYPMKIELDSSRGKLHFEAFSPVEKFRIADYGDEKYFLDRFIEALKPNDIVFDIGASVGLVSIHAATFTDSGKVIAFEPDHETFERLKHNVSLNNLSNIEFVSWAVSDTQGKVILFSDGASGFAPTLREQKNRPGAPTNQVTVQTRTLDEAILSGDLPLPTVLKIDIEGAEVLCLRGASKLLRGELGDKPRLVFLELHPEFLPYFGSSRTEVHNFVLSKGYSVVWENECHGQIHYCYQNDESLNVLNNKHN